MIVSDSKIDLFFFFISLGPFLKWQLLSKMECPKDTPLYTWEVLKKLRKVCDYLFWLFFFFTLLICTICSDTSIE